MAVSRVAAAAEAAEAAALMVEGALEEQREPAMTAVARAVLVKTVPVGATEAPMVEVVPTVEVANSPRLVQEAWAEAAMEVQAPREAEMRAAASMEAEGMGAVCGDVVRQAV